MKKVLAILTSLVLILLNMIGLAESSSRNITINLDSATDEEIAEAITALKAEQSARIKTSIQLDVTDISLNKGAIQKVNASVIDLPDQVKAGKFSWTSSDESVATCKNGTIKVVGEGNAIITCASTLSDGNEITASINVTGLLPVQNINLTESKMTVKVGSAIVPQFTISPENASNQTVVIISSNEKVVSMNESGQLMAVSPGKATITITAEDGSKKSAKLQVTVIENVGEYDDVITFAGIPWMESFDNTIASLSEAGYIKADSLDHLKKENANIGGYYLLWREDLGKKGIAECRLTDDKTQNKFMNIKIFGEDLSDETTIGGYSPVMISANFINQDGEPKLVLFNIGLKLNNKDEAFEDLTTKLTSIYGKPHNFTMGSILAYNCWIGKDDSCILLGNGTDSLVLRYGLYYSAEFVQSLEEVITNGVDSSDNSGL